MAYANIDPTGCEIRKGYLKVKIRMYLEPSDPYYYVHHVEVIDEDNKEYKRGYKGKVDKDGVPLDETDYNNWLNGLPLKWQDNPFNNHFLMLDANISQSELLQIIKDITSEFFDGWCQGKKPTDIWKAKPFVKREPKILDSNELSIATQKLETIKGMVVIA